MAEKIVIASLDIDMGALLKSTTELKAEIDRLKEAQKQLTKEGDTASEQYVQNVADLKTLNSAYNANVKAISDSTTAQADQANQSKLVALALGSEAQSIKEAREQNSLLNRLRNETNVTTVEGKAQLDALNEKLNQNNNFIKENADQYLQQKINIGNYKDSITEALGELNLFNGGLGGFMERAQASGGAGNLLRDSLSGATSGMMGMVKASLAFIATPIGAIIAALVAAFALVKAAMNRSEDATNKLKVAFAAVSGVVNTVLKVLEPLGKFLIDGIVMGFELAGQAADKALDIISGGLSMLGFDDAAKSVKGFQNEMKVAVKEAAALADAEAKLEKQQRLSQKVQLDYQKDAEKFRQIRDDENLTIAQRIKANEDLGVVLKKQLNEELKIAQLALQVANARIKAEGKTKEALDAQAEALTTISDIQERITGQESEQLTNRVALQKEAADKAKEIRDKAIEDALNKSRQEIELFKAKESEKAKTAQEQYDFNKKLFEKENADLKLQYDKGKINKLQYETEKLKLSQDFALQNADTLAQFANAELNLFLEQNKSKLEGAQTLTDELVKEEENRLRLIAQKQTENLAREKDIDIAKLEQKKLNNEALTVAELEFETERIRIADETDKTIQANKKTLEDQVKAQKAEQLAIDKELALAEAETQAEEDRIKAEQEYQTEMERLTKLLTDKKITQDQFDALKASADKKKEEMDRVASLNRTQAQLQEFQKVGAGLESLFGKNKAIASATALINGGLAVTEILKTPSVLPEPAASISRAIQIAGTVATTARSVAQINGAKFEQGGIVEIGGKRHSAGGTKFYGEDGTMFEAEAGEGIGILNRSAFSTFMDFNNRFGSGSSASGFFQGGGIITQGVRTESANLDAVVEAIANIPPPVVAVEEIQSVGNRFVQVQQNANL